MSGERLIRTETPSAEDREQRQSLWWYLLIGAFVLLAAETALSQISGRQRAEPKGAA